MQKECQQRLSNLHIRSFPTKSVFIQPVYFKLSSANLICWVYSHSLFFFCIDIDECHYVNNSCHQHAYCFNSPGSFSCQCKLGYQGSGLQCLCKSDGRTTLACQLVNVHPLNNFFLKTCL